MPTSSDMSNPNIGMTPQLSPNYADTPTEGVNTQTSLRTNSQIASQLYRDFLTNFENLSPEEQRDVLKKVPVALANYLKGVGGPPPAGSSEIPMDEIGKMYSVFKNGGGNTAVDGEQADFTTAKSVLAGLFSDNNVQEQAANEQLLVSSNTLVQTVQNQGAQSRQNEWFTPGFMVALFVQMNILAQSLLQSEITSMKTLIAQMNALWDLAKNEAALNIQQGQLKANSLIAQGISNILNGALALGMVFKDFKAKKEADQEFKESMNAKAKDYFDKAGNKAIYDKAEFEKTGELKSITDKPTSAKVLEAREADKVELKKLQEQESELQKFREEKGDFVNRAIMNKVRTYEGIQKAVESFNNAGVNFMQAYTELQTSAIDASLALNRGSQEILRRGAENSDRNMQSMLDALREIWQMLNKVTDDNYRAFSANG